MPGLVSDKVFKNRQCWPWPFNKSHPTPQLLLGVLLTRLALSLPGKPVHSSLPAYASFGSSGSSSSWSKNFGSQEPQLPLGTGKLSLILLGSRLRTGLPWVYGVSPVWSYTPEALPFSFWESQRLLALPISSPHSRLGYLCARRQFDEDLGVLTEGVLWAHWWGKWEARQ